MRIKQNQHIILPCILVILSVLDLAFTLIFLDSGRGIEKNPVMRYMFEEHGYVTTSVIKLTVTGLCCYMMGFALKKTGDNPFVCLLCYIALGMYALLGLWWIYCWIIFFFY